MARRTIGWTARAGAALVASVALVLSVTLTASAQTGAVPAVPAVGAVERAAPGSSVAKDELLFYAGGRYTYVNTTASGGHASTLRSGTYASGYQSIVPVDLDGDRQDELIFHSTRGVWTAYDVHAGATLSTVLSRTSVSAAYEQAVAFDINGDHRDEVLLYDAQSGRYAFYRLSSTGALGTRIASGTWTGRWTSVVAVDLGGDQQDELLLYRASDGHAVYYDVSTSGVLSKIRSTTYGTGWSEVVAPDIDADPADELMFYNRSTRAVKFYDLASSAQLGRLLRSDRYQSSWSVAVSGNFDQPAASSTVQAMLSAVNARRADAGLRPLQLSTTMNNEAQRWSLEQAADGRISHRSNLATGLPSGWRYIGENVASGYGSVSAVMGGWMSSPGHRANILNARFTHLGVGIARDSDGTPYWTQIFAQY